MSYNSKQKQQTHTHPNKKKILLSFIGITSHKVLYTRRSCKTSLLGRIKLIYFHSMSFRMKSIKRSSDGPKDSILLVGINKLIVCPLTLEYNP